MLEKGRWTTLLLLVVIVLLAGLLVRQGGAPPRIVHAEGGAGIFAFAGEPSSGSVRIYIVDTKREIIASYAVVTGQMRLVATRRYTYDMQVMDSSKVPGLTTGGPNTGSYDAIREFVENRAAQASPRP